MAKRFWRQVDGCIPDESMGAGVYALYDENKLLYVGQTCQLRRRLLRHDRHVFFDAVKVALVRDRLERLRLERKLVYRLRPPLNRKPPSSLWTGRYFTISEPPRRRVA